MSQAENLLDSLTVDDITPYTAEPQTEGHIVIGKDRFITVPESLKRIAVQGDKNIETVTFDCPRYWDEHDLFDMQIFVNFMRPDGYTSSYVAQNKTVDPDDTSIIHFTWTIDEDVTEYKGNLKFLVCSKIANEETGVEELHWNSEINDEMFISEGLECEQHIVEQNYAIITQLLIRMDEVEAIAIQKSEMEDIVSDITEKVVEAEAATATVTEKANDMVAIFDKFDRVIPVNRYDGSSTIGYMKADGTVVLDDDYYGPPGDIRMSYTGYIPVTAGEVISLQADEEIDDYDRIIQEIEFVAAFDANKNILPSLGVNNLSTTSSYYTVPNGVAYIRISSETIFYSSVEYDTQYRNVAIVASETVVPYEPYFDPTYGELNPEAAISTTSQLGNAIKGKASGAVIKIDDISPAMHNVNCWVHGKNLFNGVLSPGILRSAAFEIDTPNSAVYRTIIMHIPKPGTYTISFSVPVYIARIVKDGFYGVTSGYTSVTNYTFSVKDAGDFGMTVRDATSSDTPWSESNTVQVEVGSVATEYEPYIDPTTVTVSRFGKNLLDISKKATTDTISGVTITRIGDQIKLNGTLTTDSNLFNTTFHMAGGVGNTYTLSYIPDGGTVSGDASICIGAKDTADSSTSRQSWLNLKLTGSTGSFTNTLSRPYIKDFWFYVKAGTKFSDYRIRVQLERGDVATEHEVSKKATYTPNGAGIADVVSVSPIMNIFTDTPSAVMDCEYNRDTEKVVEETNSYIEKVETGVHASAIRGSLSGVSVRADDVSPFKHDLDVKVRSKNILPNSYIGRTINSYGVTVVGNADGSFTVSGTNTRTDAAFLYIDVFSYVNGDYFISEEDAMYSGSPRGYGIGADGGLKMLLETRQPNGNAAYNPCPTEASPTYITGKIPKGSTIRRLYLMIPKGYTFETPITFYPQLEYGTVATEFTYPSMDVEGVAVTVSDGENTQTMAADVEGNVEGLMSMSPSMTLTTDNAGAVIECGYYRDATKVIKSLEERLAALEAK